jgi:hypothetical protein
MEEDYLLLADLTGYSTFLAGVGRTHGVDFSNGVPAGFAITAALLDAVVEGLGPAFEVEKLEGDAVFAVAEATSLDGRGDEVIALLRSVHMAFRLRREEAAVAATDDICTACGAVSAVDLKMLLHRGQSVRQVVGSRSELLGPAVNVVHRLLKNTIAPRFGYRPYLFLTDLAAGALGVPDVGLAHGEDYPDVAQVTGRIVDLGEP